MQMILNASPLNSQFVPSLTKLCSSRKKRYSPHGRSSEIPRGMGVSKVKNFEAEYEAKLKFPVGGGSIDFLCNCTIR